MCQNLYYRSLHVVLTTKEKSSEEYLHFDEFFRWFVKCLLVL